MLDDTIKTSKLNFGDLAGSELAKRTGSEGTTLEEAGKIHQGLLVLERVITALVEKRPHIPYKDSKLTRILGDSLGGNSKTTIIVCCSPHIWNRAETISALRFAQRAKTITNKAIINKKRTREQLEKRIQQLEGIIVDLQKRLKAKHSANNNNNGQESVVVKEVVSEEQTKKIEQLTEELEALKTLLDKKNEQLQACLMFFLFSLCKKKNNN
ncbi:kinesin-related motor protein [Reticulomyxa filosa]|uniref:Kinesin-related motor protein n=1 Tax=Reticulomyxa filosa TaxID=46433 RepID=X6N9L2_RETFI|nr:kinesin-related motor protein [Reticulomyxa filosa]|eukprot:ETO21987.1 kinesin-related motor protein [Reticulomyxa filosa]